MSSRRHTRLPGLISTAFLLCAAAVLSCSDSDPGTTPEPLDGACCFEGGGCEILTREECDDQDGFWQGGGSACDPNPCPEEFVGACCIPGGGCEVLTLEDCDARNGAWHGPGSVCSPNPCPDPPTGVVWIPAGYVRLGGVWGAEPAHDVHVAGFWIGTYEVTNAGYLEFIDAGGYDRESWWHPLGWGWRIREDIRHPAGWNSEEHHGGGIQGNGHFPVIGVSWWEADAYCRWAGGRLPTEAEWERAARGGCEMWGDPAECDAASTPSYPWGEGISGQRANYWGSGGPYDNSVTPVGFYDGSTRNGFPTVDSPSPYGLYDVAGNAWEWTSTRHMDYPYQAGDGREDPPASENECCRVLRGGSYLVEEEELRCSHRNYIGPTNREFTFGFRLAGDW